MAFKKGTQYSAEHLQHFSDKKDTAPIVVNGTTEVYVWDGTDWVLADTLDTGAYQYFTRGLYLKFVPISGTFTLFEE